MLFWILVVTFIIMKLGNGNYLDAVVQSTFVCLSVGMIASVAVLVYALWKQGYLGRLILRQKAENIYPYWSVNQRNCKGCYSDYYFRFNHSIVAIY